MLHIFIDADACPVKQEVYRVAKRYGLQVTLVANAWMRTPSDGRVSIEVVGSDPDAADDWIAEHVQKDDIVITADIPLASRCVQHGACVLGSKGKEFNEENIGQILATRDLLSELRGLGEVTGGPAPMTQKHRSQFLQQLDKVIQRLKREPA